MTVGEAVLRDLGDSSSPGNAMQIYVRVSNAKYAACLCFFLTCSILLNVERASLVYIASALYSALSRYCRSLVCLKPPARTADLALYRIQERPSACSG